VTTARFVVLRERDRQANIWARSKFKQDEAELFAGLRLWFSNKWRSPVAPRPGEPTEKRMTHLGSMKPAPSHRRGSAQQMEHGHV
jgi:hypothetical protein